MSGNDEYTVIIDIGQGTTKVGLAGDEKPKIFHTIVGKPKYQQMMQGVNVQDVYVGDDTERMRGVLKLDYPVSRGNVMDWNHYYAILNHIFYNSLRLDTKKCNVVYLVPPLTPPDTAIYFARVLFETHQCKSVVIMDTASASMFSLGENTALSIEIGAGLTHVTPVMNGQLYNPSIQRLNLAGGDIDEYLSSLLSQYGQFQKKEIVIDIKEKMCEITPNVEIASKDPKYAKSYTLPDGDHLKLNSVITTYAGEILFNPQLLNYPISSIPQAVIQALQRVDRYYWRPLLKKIILTGGTSLFKGLESRLIADIEKLLPQLGPLPEPVIETPTPKSTEQKEKEDDGAKKLVQIKTGDSGMGNCPKCGELFHMGESRFCPYCGAEATIKQIDIIGSDRVEYPSVCPACKNKLDGQSSFCPECGQKLEPIVTKEDLDRKEKKLLKKASASERDLEKIAKDVESEYGDLEEEGSWEEPTPKNSLSSPSSKSVEPDDPNQIIKFITGHERHYAGFKGASMLGKIPEFRKLMLTKTDFDQNPYAIILDYSKIVHLVPKK
jgi:actin-related protein